VAGRATRIALIAAAACAGALAVLLSQAPASLLAGAVNTSSQSRLQLADPSGTVWQGEADLVLQSGARETPERTRLPGRTSWHIDPWRLLGGSLDLQLANAALSDAPLLLRLDAAGNGALEAGRLRLPAQVLVGLGAPWNTVRPGGRLELEWDTLHLAAGSLRGTLRLEWRDASSGLSPVVPFGSYRLQADGIFDGAALSLETLSGPMEMMGNGTIADGLHLRFQGSARVRAGTDEAVATQLSGLVSLLGRSDGGGAILNFGT